MARPQPVVGDVFVIPLSDGRWAVGQVVAVEPSAMNSVMCSYFDARLDDPSCPVPSVASLPLLSVQLTTSDSFKSEKWKIIGTQPPIGLDRQPHYGEWRRNKFVGATIYGSGIMTRFLEAFYALGPWDAYKDPAYFDKLLQSASLKPSRLIYKSSQTTAGD